MFLVEDDSGEALLLRVHNCLYGGGMFNLLSVSQICQGEFNSVDFNLDSPSLLLSTGSKNRPVRLPLFLEDGLFAISGAPFPLDDPRYSSLRKADVTPGGLFRPSDDSAMHRWSSKVLVAANATGRFLVAQNCDYDYNLQSYCANFLAPPSIPLSRRQYDPAIAGDMAELTTRFLGLGADRLKRTIELSNGLATPATKSKIRVPDLKPFFPPGRWSEGKTPRVSKHKVGGLYHAGIGEVVFTDTFESGDSKYRYGQAYFDLASHWGDVFPLRSRNDVGVSFADFCSRNWIPVILVRDNIGENIGGSLIEECRSRNVKSAYICPRHPQQNYAEGYLGRITAMASFAMVFAGAPLFMWVYAVRTAVFVSNISASYYSKQGIWSTPYMLIHGESFPDSSIVVPFGCAVLVLRDSNDRAKFMNRAVLMIFVHYSEDHPLFTYAVYSPRTKRVLHRQDVIFLTSVFPMRSARVESGLGPAGETLTLFRSPPSMLDQCPADLSFGDWGVHDQLPPYDDDVNGFPITAPYGNFVDVPEEMLGVPVQNPSHPSFPTSSVLVPIPAVPSLPHNSRTVVSSPSPVSLASSVAISEVKESEVLPSTSVSFQERQDSLEESVGPTSPEVVTCVLGDSGAAPPRRSMRTQMRPSKSTVQPSPPDAGDRRHRPVGERWFYEPVGPTAPTDILLAHSVPLEGPDGVTQGMSSPAIPPVTSSPMLIANLGASVLPSDGNHQPPPRAPTPWGLRLQSAGPTGRFAIRLVFPGGELGAQLFMVTTAMTVPTLSRAIANMMNVPPPVTMYVAPVWAPLNHEGFIVDRFLPGTAIPCPYLAPGTVVRVFRAPTDDPGFRLAMYPDFSSSSEVPDTSIGLSLESENLLGLASRSQLVSFDDSGNLLSVAPRSQLASFDDFSSSSESLVSRESENLLGLASRSQLVSFDDSGNLLSVAPRSQLASFDDFSSSSEILVSIGRPMKNGEGRAIMTAREVARYDDNTLRRLQVIDLHNATPSAELGGLSPHDLVYGPREDLSLRQDNRSEPARVSGESDVIGNLAYDAIFTARPGMARVHSSSVRIEELPDSFASSSVLPDSLVSLSGHDSSDDSPPTKRPRSGELMEDESDSPRDIPDPLDNPKVSRHERAVLLKMFKKEQRLARKQYRASLRGIWEADIADNKENCLSQEEGERGETILLQPFDQEVETEAFENFLFDRMMIYDGDAAFMLVRFRESLRVIPAHLGGPDPALIRIRTANLWEGLRRVYFGEQEVEPVAPVPALTHEQVMNNLRQEIAELEERKERAQRRSRGADSGRPPSILSREDEEDDSPPPSSIAHTNVAPVGRSGLIVAASTVVLPSSSSAETDQRRSSGASRAVQLDSVSGASSSREPNRKLVLLSKRVLRRIMAAKESLVKFGTFVPRNDREANQSPEAPRWKAGRDLEWFRLQKEGTFDGEWTWEKVQASYPNYKKSDVGYLFYVYDFKFSGEHRVRLVFDGSRQAESTYKETYAPTVRAESVRLFHVFCVEEGLHIGQYDVPQAFLKADIDHDIFVYPPRGQSEFNGQLLKLRRALYGGKQSAFLWFTMINAFLLSLDFKSSQLDSCFYRRSDAVLILYCDDLRIGASPSVLASLHGSLSEKFSITTAPGDRFLGMDVAYDPVPGILKLSMRNYIETTMERFKDFDLSQGYPYRELVGCLLWITLNVMGPELLRVKDLARLSNSFGEPEYTMALKVLRRIFVRRHQGIVMFRHAAGREIVPSATRPQAIPLGDPQEGVDDLGANISQQENEITKHSLCQGKALISDVGLSYTVEDSEQFDIPRMALPVNLRYRLMGYGDASFAVGESKQSITGFVIYLNGVPLLWGSLKQTVVVDSSCSAEFVAASVTCKQLVHAENMLGFLGFSSQKPYPLYTDSKACLHIASNPSRLGNVRHLQIRYHLVRCYVSLGDVTMCFCVTEEMVADLLTKIVVGAQDYRLSLRFYSLLPESANQVSGFTDDLNTKELTTELDRVCMME